MYSNPSCYASALGGCSKNMSREHFISEGALSHLANDFAINDQDKGRILTFGFSKHDCGNGTWLTPKHRALSPKILCVTHNSSLSTLDTLHKELVVCLSVAREFCVSPENKGKTKIRHFDGHLFERYLLKEMIGFIASGRIEPLGKLFPPLDHLQMLYGIAPLPDAWGLNIRTEFTPSPVMTTLGYEFDFLQNKAGNMIAGCIKKVHDIQFILAFYLISSEPNDYMNTKNTIYRPSGLNFTNPEHDIRFELVFDWKDQLSHQPVNIVIQQAS